MATRKKEAGEADTVSLFSTESAKLMKPGTVYEVSPEGITDGRITQLNDCPQDLKYPDWQSVWPKEDSPEGFTEIAFSVEMLEKVVAAAKANWGKKSYGTNLLRFRIPKDHKPKANGYFDPVVWTAADSHDDYYLKGLIMPFAHDERAFDKD